jgi:CBS domain-containing protein
MSELRNILDRKGTDVYAIRPGASVLDAVDELCRHHIGALLVEEKGAPLGILSERDILMRVILRRRDPAATLVRDVMTKDVICVDLDSSPEEAMRIMTEQRCRHLPAVEEGRIAGMISIGDLVRWVSANQEFEVRILQEYLLEGKYPG